MSLLPLSTYPSLSKDDLILLRKNHFEKWEEFFSNQSSTLPEVRDVIFQSWNRCKEYEELNPMIQGSIKNVTDEKLKELRTENELFHLAKPILKQAEQDLSYSNHVILFSNHDGIILDSFGNNFVSTKLGNSVNANIGSNWSERWAGTNGIGASLYLQQPVQIFSSEHFSFSCHDWVCSSAPILNPLTHELLGAINLSTTSDTFHPLSMMKTIQIANQIERTLFHHYYQAQVMMHDQYIEWINKWKKQTVFLCNTKGAIIKTNSRDSLDELQSFLYTTVNKKEFVDNKEGEIETTLCGRNFHFLFKKIYWNNRFIGFITVLDRKEKQNVFTKSHNHHAKYSIQSLIGQSIAIKEIKRIVQISASSDSNIMITGESGTGKELVANAIHEASNRANHPFIAINCAAIPKELLPSELFGYVAGAFTGANPKGSVGKFELANRGTLFLDELGDMPLEAQVHLLRVIQEQEVIRIGNHTRIPIDVRVIAATNKNLEEEMLNGNFRKDLFYRLNVINLELPPLRHRLEDLPLLVEHFVQKLTSRKLQGSYHVTSETMEYLQRYSWPGNIRELENVIEYAVNFSTNGIIIPENLPKHVTKQTSYIVDTKRANPVNQAELEWITSTLKKHQMNVSKAARELNLSRSTLYRKLKKMGHDIKTLK
ncbi:sigma-54-dependent Fis family transcriptional regulator [Bacillus coreaensis]